MLSLTLLLVYLLRVVLLTRLDIFPDEAYYWDWHRFLSLGYFDHPPLIAWFVHLISSIWGDTYWGIKAVPLICSLLTTIALYILATKFLASFASQLFLIILMQATLLYWLGGLLLTPDVVFLLFWTLGLLLAYIAIFEHQKWAWPLLGLVSGLGLLSKYVFVLFIVAFALFLLFDKSNRKLFFTWKPWLAFLIALLVFMPNVLWNAQHDWASYIFQMEHGLESKHPWPQMHYFTEYLGTQMGLFSPFMFILLFIAGWHIVRRRHSDTRFLFLGTFTFFPLLFFAWSSLSARVEGNWPAPAYISGLLLVMWYAEVKWRERKNRYIFMFASSFSIFSTLLVLLHIFVPFLPLKPHADRTFEPIGWQRLAQQVDSVRIQVDPEFSMPVCTIDYQMASLLAFHLSDQPRTWALNLSSRVNHYAFLPERETIINDMLLFVAPITSQQMPNHISKFFGTRDYLAPVLRYMTPSVADTFAVYQVTLSPMGKHALLSEVSANILHVDAFTPNQ